MQDIHYLVPQQQEGIEKNLSYKIDLDTVENAEDWFVDSKERMLDVNNWQKHAPLVSASFQLTDSHGHNMGRHARKGDYIKIDIPGPGPAAGEGYDWVVIEAIEYDDYPDLGMESFAMHVRPSVDPQHKGEGIAHFFSNNATSTFVVERRGKHMAAYYYGRNESANTDAGVVDAARNTVVAIAAWMGLSDAQWANIITGFIELDTM